MQKRIIDFFIRGLSSRSLLYGLVLGGLLAGCSIVPSSWVHQIDVQQGNIVTQDMLDRLKPGMDPQQVREILGTPLVVDPFHPQRWDYVYSFAHGDGPRERRHITVVFEDDRLARVEGDVRVREQTP